MVLTGMMTACAAQTHTTPITPISALKLLAVQEIPYDARFKGTTVGGLSGIDYDSTQQSYYLISDDRSALQPARFYTMKVYLNNQGFDSLRITDVVTLRQPDGYPFPNTQQDNRAPYRGHVEGLIVLVQYKYWRANHLGLP